MSTRVKICGVNSPEAFDAALEAGADWVGFVFFPASPRAVTPAAAASLSRRHDGGAGRVGLFVAPDDDAVASALDCLRLDALQVYAPSARIAALRARFGVPVWQALGVAGAEELPHDAGSADALVVEAKPPPGADRPGGNAASLDWSLLRGWRPPCPWLLAGGLRPDNVGRAIEASGAVAVDVSSGVESAPGIKDAALIRDFVNAARRPRAD